MKFSEKTITVLKNFSTINQSMLFRPGNMLRSISAQSTILAKAEIDETFDSEFAIHDLSRFLGVISLFQDPEVEINEKDATIRSGKEKLVYVYADASSFKIPPAKDVGFPIPDVTFNLKAVDFQKVQRAGSVMQLPELAVVGDGSTIHIKAVDTKNPTADSFIIEVGETDFTFNTIFKSENLKIISEDYVVDISSKGICRFSSDKLTYWVATEATSTFN